MTPLLLAQISSDEEVIIPVVAIVGGLLVAVVAIVVGGIRGVIRTRSRERSRREIAAYVAEGTITPADAKALLEAGEGPGDRGSCR